MKYHIISFDKSFSITGVTWTPRCLYSGVGEERENIVQSTSPHLQSTINEDLEYFEKSSHATTSFWSAAVHIAIHVEIR